MVVTVSRAIGSASAFLAPRYGAMKSSAGFDERSSLYQMVWTCMCLHRLMLGVLGVIIVLGWLYASRAQTYGKELCIGRQTLENERMLDGSCGAKCWRKSSSGAPLDTPFKRHVHFEESSDSTDAHALNSTCAFGLIPHCRAGFIQDFLQESALEKLSMKLQQVTSLIEDDVDLALALALQNAIRNIVKEKRISEDGKAYTYNEFVEFFGQDVGPACWERSEPQDIFDDLI